MNMECRQQCRHEQYGKCRIRALGIKRATGCVPCPYFEAKKQI